MLDVAGFETSVGQAAAVTMYTGELLPDCDDDWILTLTEVWRTTL